MEKAITSAVKIVSSEMEEANPPSSQEATTRSEENKIPPLLTATATIPNKAENIEKANIRLLGVARKCVVNLFKRQKQLRFRNMSMTKQRWLGKRPTC